MKLISLSQQGKNKNKYFAKVDDEDYEYLNQFKWHASIQKQKNYTIIYASRKFGEKVVKMHTFLIGEQYTKLIDHKNNNGLDNQRHNLKICSLSLNLLNRRNWGKSKYRGVTFHKRYNKYIVAINISGTLKHIGYFKEEIDAAKAYNEAAKKYHGEFANLNIIP